MKLLDLIDRGIITLHDQGEVGTYIKRILIIEDERGEPRTYITPFRDPVDERWKSLSLPSDGVLASYFEEYITQSPASEKDLSKCIRVLTAYKEGRLLADYGTWTDKIAAWIPAGVMQYLRRARISPALLSVVENIYMREDGLVEMQGFTLFSLFIEGWVRTDG